MGSWGRKYSGVISTWIDREIERIKGFLREIEGSPSSLLKSKIQSSTYKPSIEEVTEKIKREVLEDLIKTIDRYSLYSEEEKRKIIEEISKQLDNEIKKELEELNKIYPVFKTGGRR
jgi:cell division protein YceG involved in septum cleavage